LHPLRTPGAGASCIATINPQGRFADVLARLQDHPAKRIGNLLPGNWKGEHAQKGGSHGRKPIQASKDDAPEGSAKRLERVQP
jgi:hypothetical protein